jgi:glycosyltransferase involved in cell wall biosynthesis
MNDGIAVSVVISTFNRGAVLQQALDRILNQDATDFVYEIIVVDNNSHDNTRAVVDSFLARGVPGLRYVFEGRQGVSYGRNAGIAAARAPIIAFFDDDILVPRDWLATIKRIMDQHPEADFIGGRVLPEWSMRRPAWLTQTNWSPLALVDYGPTPLYVSSENQLCLVAANLAVRRSLFESVGVFSAHLQRVKDGIGSMEDHELLIRCWRAGKRGLYAPDLIVRTDVPPIRMTKAYHRRWHRGHGFFSAMIRSLEDAADVTTSEVVTLFDVPGCLYRQLAGEAFKFAGAWLRRQPDVSFRHENNVRFLASYIVHRRSQERVRDDRSAVMEVARFANKLLRKKVRAALGGRRAQSA